MSTQQDDVVAQFLLGMLPARLLNAFNIIAKLSYPISDKHSLVCQLDELISADKCPDKPLKPSADLIRRSIEPVDFPIETPRSGLEKLHARLSVQLGSVEIPDRDSIDMPDICDIYERTFGRICGQEACDVYQEALRGGRSEAQAIIAGHLAGEECQRRVAEALRDFLRRAREPRPRPWPWF